jgi:hypothetical protein
MPTGLEYREAIQNPRQNFDDPELKTGEPLRDQLGLPKPITGNFAAVFTMQCDSKRYAVKCFFRAFEDQLERYRVIHKYLDRAEHPWEVDFQFLARGIRVGAEWHPVVKMEWADAVRFDQYVKARLGAPHDLASLAERFAELIADLRTGGIAHCDLQHGNILVTPDGELRLVDYDGMYVPALDGRGSHELGHPNYQHPARSASDFGAYTDNFSAWVIYVSLIALSIDPSIWSRVNAGDEQLIFNRQDFEASIYSPGFGALQMTGNPFLVEFASEMKRMLGRSVRDVPDLVPVKVGAIDQGASVAFAASAPLKASARGQAGQLPWWMDGSVPATAAASRASATNAPGLEWMIGQLPQPPVVVLGTVAALPKRVLQGIVVTTLLFALLGILGLFELSVAVAGAALTVIVGIGFERIAFAMTPEVRQRRAAGKQVRAHRRDSKEANGDAAAAIERLDQRVERERHDLEKLDKKQAEVRKREQSDLASSQKQLQKTVDAISKRRTGLAVDEQRDRASRLKGLQEEILAAELARATLRAASIPRVGADAKSQMAYFGMQSAADIKGVNIYGNDALIVRADGHAIKVRGVGPAKARAIQSWLVAAQSKARTKLPTTLPQIEAQRIQQKYAQQMAALAGEEQVARQQAQVGADQIRAKSQQEQAAIMGEMNSVRVRAAEERRQLDGAVEVAQKAANETQWRYAQAARDREAFRMVTFGRFLLRAADPR